MGVVLEMKDRLIDLRKEKKLTQKEIANKLGIARTTYSGYENGSREPDHDTLQKIADFHEVTIDYLLHYSDVRYNPDQLTGLDREIYEEYLKLSDEDKAYIAETIKRIKK